MRPSRSSKIREDGDRSSSGRNSSNAGSVSKSGRNRHDSPAFRNGGGSHASSSSSRSRDSSPRFLIQIWFLFLFYIFILKVFLIWFFWSSSRGRGGNQQQSYSKTDSPNAPALRITNLPTRSTDQAIKDGLFHKYKKLGKVVSVKVVGEGEKRFALVTFRR